MSTVISGTGSHLPDLVVSNDDIEAASSDFDRERSGCTLDEFVQGRVGIIERHRRRDDEGVVDLALPAARLALESAEVEAEELDLIVLSTFTADHRLPHSAPELQAELGSRAKCFQLENACMGFVDAVITADALMPAQGYRTALVVHAEAMSAIIDPSLFLAQALFADGAGAVVLRSSPGDRAGLISSATQTDGSKAFWLRAGGGTKSPITPECLADRSHYFDLEHQLIHPFAVEKMVDAVYEVLNRAEASVEDVDWFVCHQTGVNITLQVAERLKVEPERFLMTLEHTGNTSGATIPIALDEYNRRGFFTPGDRIVMPAVGAGMAWGALYAFWGG